MTNPKSEELRMLAAKIASAYVQANPQAPDQLINVIRLAYLGLQRCAAPQPIAPTGTMRKRRRRSTSPSS